MKEIKLTRGLTTLVDNEDSQYLNQWKWYAQKSNNTYYACRQVNTLKERKNIWMHRLVLNPGGDKVIDHRNHNTLDNQRYNLRICTKKENQRNRKVSSHSKSGIKGVRKIRNRWEAKIIVDGKRIFLGYYDNKVLASKAYDIAAIRYFKDFAYLNNLEVKC